MTWKWTKSLQPVKLLKRRLPMSMMQPLKEEMISLAEGN